MKDSLYILMAIVHFLADFGLQTDNQAKTKSTSIPALVSHVATYSVVWFVVCLGLTDYTGWNVGDCILFAEVTFLFHLLTDLITSKITKKFWDAGDMHNAFVTIGFDQVFHFVQLFFTFKFIFYFHNTHI